MPITNPGTAPHSFKWTATLTASASSIRVINNTEDEPPLIIDGLTAGQSVVIQGEPRMVIRSGTPSPALVQPGSTWPALLPGVNDVAISGGTGTFSYTPEYL